MTKITFNFSPIKKTSKSKIEKSDIIGTIVKINNIFYFVTEDLIKYPITKNSFDVSKLKEYYILLPNGEYIFRCVTSSYPPSNPNHYLPFKERCKVKGRLLIDSSGTYFEYKETIEIIDKESYKTILNGI